MSADLLEKALRRPERWYPTSVMRQLRSINGVVLTLQQKWVSNHDNEEWRDIEIVDDVDESDDEQVTVEVRRVLPSQEG